MRRMTWTGGLGLLLILGGCSMRADDSATGVLHAEREFARLSRDTDMRTAFLAYLAPDAVIFRPGPVAGRTWFEARPAPEGTLVWEPALSRVATSGDLAVNAGPWEYRDGPDGPASGAG